MGRSVPPAGAAVQRCPAAPVWELNAAQVKVIQCPELPNEDECLRCVAVVFKVHANKQPEKRRAL